jgi:hypothetical protein
MLYYLENKNMTNIPFFKCKEKINITYLNLRYVEKERKNTF